MSQDAPFLSAPKGGFVFIVTYGRSGSTLLQNLLNSIDGYCIRGENNNALYHVMRAWDSVANSVEVGKRIRALRGESEAPDPAFGTSSDPWYGAEHIDAGALARQLADSFTGSVLAPPAGTRVAGFKEIRFHIHRHHFTTYLDFMRMTFPKARFLFNTRDHEAVLRSGWWAQLDPQGVREELMLAEKLFAEYAAAHPECSMSLHYDDYNGQPKALRPMYEFLEERFDPQQVRSVMKQKLTHLKTPA